MQALRDIKQVRTYRLLAATIVAGLFWVWWDSFHEIGRFFMQIPLPFPVVFLRYSSVSCFAKPAGIVLGCLLLCLLLRSCKNFFARKRLPVVLFAIEAGLHFVYYALVISHQILLACWVYAAISLCAVLTILLIALQVNQFESREIVLVVIGSIAFYGVFNNLVFPCFLLGSSLEIIGAFYLAALVVSYSLSCSFFGQSFAIKETQDKSRARTPLPLIAHLVIYGLAFGILHVIGGAVARGHYSVNIAVFFACIVTIACLAFLFLRKSSNHEIWSKIRSTVFPLSVIGYLLIPLVSNSDAALALTEAGNLLYNAIFFIGCFTLMRRTYVDPRTIIAKGLLYKNVGMILGILWARQFYEQAMLDGVTPALLPVIIVFLLTVATFWVGSDEQIRKTWGLRKNLSPKQYNDRLLQLKCEILTKDYRLTSRESEMLRFLAQGKRAPEIKEDLGVSIDTVRSHIKHLYAKLDVHSLNDLGRLLKHTEVDEKEMEC